MPFLAPLVVLSTAAFTQDPPAPVEVIPEVTELVIDDAVAVQGALVRPAVLSTMELQRQRFNPLVRLREDFAAELRASLRASR